MYPVGRRNYAAWFHCEQTSFIGFHCFLSSLTGQDRVDSNVKLSHPPPVKIVVKVKSVPQGLPSPIPGMNKDWCWMRTLVGLEGGDTNRGDGNVYSRYI